MLPPFLTRRRLGRRHHRERKYPASPRIFIGASFPPSTSSSEDKRDAATERLHWLLSAEAGKIQPIRPARRHWSST